MNKKIKIIIIPKKSHQKEILDQILKDGKGITDDLDIIDELVFDRNIDVEFIRENVNGTISHFSKESLKNLREMGLDIVEHI